MTTTAETPRRPTLLVILDGFGINPDPTHNAIMLAETPNFDRYFADYPMTTLAASGRGVGLPVGQMGNSEVGHVTIGSGCIIKQDLVRIDDAIEDGSFFDNEALLQAVRSAYTANRPLHLIGLVSDGGVHSHINHLLALILLCKRHQVVPMLHMITDGRDTAPQAAVTYLPDLEATLTQCGGHIASLCGRYYAMDRDQRWERVQQAFANIVNSGEFEALSAHDAIRKSYAAGINDEFIKPIRLAHHDPVQAGDAMLFFNFRNDRVRQICAAFADPRFNAFDRGVDYQPITVTTMTSYDPSLNLPVAFSAMRPETTLASLVSEAGWRQLHCAETEKYAHVTFFFNGGREQPYLGEQRTLIASPKVATYDLQPQMSAPQVADSVVEAMQSGSYDFIVVNFANGDMVGHTAVRSAIIAAVEVLDREVGRVLKAAVANNYAVVVTADHGNCDEMVDPITGKPQTQHSTHPVPCLVIDKDVKSLRPGTDLSAIAPTVLQLLGLPQPESMTGHSVIADDWQN